MILTTTAVIERHRHRQGMSISFDFFFLNNRVLIHCPIKTHCLVLRARDGGGFCQDVRHQFGFFSHCFLITITKRGTFFFFSLPVQRQLITGVDYHLRWTLKERNDFDSEKDANNLMVCKECS